VKKRKKPKKHVIKVSKKTLLALRNRSLKLERAGLESEAQKVWGQYEDALARNRKRRGIK
jgi:hypothetical protein